MRYKVQKSQAEKLTVVEESFMHSDTVGKVASKHSFVDVEDLTPVDGFPLPEYTMWEASCECGEVLDVEGEYTVTDVDFLFLKHLSAVIAEARISS